MSTIHRRIAALVAQAGYDRDEPIIVGLRRAADDPVFVSQRGVGDTTQVYIASLAKQLTAACAALLPELDMESPLSRWLPELPAWADTIELQHLVHHTAALPDDEIDAALAADRTTAAAIRTLTTHRVLDRRPGEQYTYSNAGYVCLAVAVERAAGQPLAEFARQRIFAPLRMFNTCFWPGPEPAPPGAQPLRDRHPAPLSLGDGGVWSTANDLLRWSQALNDDELGISALLETRGRLNDGTPVDYAWGVGVRSRHSFNVYRHGGGWPGLRTLLARVPDVKLSLVIIALDDDTERRVPLADALLDDFIRRPAVPPR